MKNRNEARNRQRLKAKIRKWLKAYKVLFITLTFNDETLQATTEQTRERLAINYLRTETALYIANRDFGIKNEREHYHAVIVATTLKAQDIPLNFKKEANKINFKAWKYGRIGAEKIADKWRPANDKDFKKTAENLAEHFHKESAKNSRLIFSRGEPTKEQQLERLERLKESNRKKLSDAEIIQEALNDLGQEANKETKDLDKEHEEQIKRLILKA